MWAVWILLCMVCFADSFPAKTFIRELKYGSKFSMTLTTLDNTVEFSRVGEWKTITLYSKSALAKRGYVDKSGKQVDFVIKSVTFDDQGTYRVTNFQTGETSVFTLKVIDTATSTKELKYGDTLNIKLPNGNDTLEYTPVGDSKMITLYSKGVSPKRGHVYNSFMQTNFDINSVTFDDQGTYRVTNLRAGTTTAYTVKVIAKQITSDRVAGETLTVPLYGLSVGDVSLSFTGEDFNLTLVDRGSAVGKKHLDYFGRIEVTGQNINILHVNVSDEGSYTLTDGLGRTVSVIKMVLTDHRETVKVLPLLALLLVLAIPAGICFCYQKGVFKKGGGSNFELLVNEPEQNPHSTCPNHPADGSTVHAPPQTLYSGPPAMNPVMYPGVNPAMPHAYNLNPAYPSAQPPQWAGVPYNPPAPAGYMTYNSPAASYPHWTK